MANQWLKRLKSMDGAVTGEYNPMAPENILRSPSPSLNWIFGKQGGIPRGYSTVFYGPAKSGKSLATYLFAGELHKNDPEAIVLRFDTEFRSLQMSPQWGIDYDRFQTIETNSPQEIFDRITGEIKEMVEEGMPLKMIIIDSLQGIQGLRDQAAGSVAQNTMGDRAGVMTKGLKQILPFLRRNKISLLATSHMRANFDAGLYGPKEKAGMVWAEKHFFEFFVQVNKDTSADSKSSIAGEKFEDETIKDFKGHKVQTGHKIYVKMAENSIGCSGLSGEFTIDYDKGLILQEEEIFQLAVNCGVFERPNNMTYVFEGSSYKGKGQCIEAISNDKNLANKLLEKIYSK